MTTTAAQNATPLLALLGVVGVGKTGKTANTMVSWYIRISSQRRRRYMGEICELKWRHRWCCRCRILRFNKQTKPLRHNRKSSVAAYAAINSSSRRVEHDPLTMCEMDLVDVRVM